MDSSDARQIVILLILLALSAFFSSAETCLTTVNKMRIKSLADDKNKNASLVLKLIEEKTQMLSAILIGNNVVNLSASSLTTTFAMKLAKSSGMSDSVSAITGIATGIITILVLIFGEIIPKSLATMNAERLSLIYAKPIYGLTNILRPISFLMNQLSNGLMHLLHVKSNHSPAITESEERQMITNVVDFGDSMAKDVMVPKMDVGFVSADISYQELFEVYKELRHTRMPVYSESRDNVIGIINVKDLFFYEDARDKFDVTTIMREPYFTYEYKKISELFFEMKKESIPLAVVLDEYGATAGILTLEDLIEEIVGEIRDEYDTNEEDEITKIDDENFILLGIAKLDDINDELGIDLESEDYDSIAGHIINLLDHFPKAGETVQDEYAEYRVLEATNNRIDKVKVHLLPQKDTTADLDEEEGV